MNLQLIPNAHYCATCKKKWHSGPRFVSPAFEPCLKNPCGLSCTMVWLNRQARQKEEAPIATTVTPAASRAPVTAPGVARCARASRYCRQHPENGLKTSPERRPEIGR